MKSTDTIRCVATNQHHLHRSTEPPYLRRATKIREQHRLQYPCARFSISVSSHTPQIVPTADGSTTGTLTGQYSGHVWNCCLGM